MVNGTDNMHSAERNQIDSPLLRLPGELRNIIYEYALDGRVWSIGYGGWDSLSGDHPRVNDTTESSDACSLLRVCHQIHTEAHHLLTYSSFYADYLRGWFADRGSRMASAATMLSLQACFLYSWFDADYWSIGGLWWQNEDLRFTDLPSLKSIELVVDCRRWGNEQARDLGSQEYNLTECNYAELHQSFLACKAHMEALNPGVTCTINAADTGMEEFDAFLVRSGKKRIV
jgi:hypothetical protein